MSPHGWADRLAAAAAGQDAQVQEQAMTMLRGYVTPGQMRALQVRWEGVLRVLPEVDGIEAAAAEWAAEERERAEAQRQGPSGEGCEG